MGCRRRAKITSGTLAAGENGERHLSEMSTEGISTHRPLHPDRRGGEDGGVVEVDDHVSQLLLDLTVVHPLAGRGDVCVQIPHE